ncbi:DMT family transporter [Roseospirillum parvum]|uniref:Permease of the drug/metabolite transporter (DMT) superfamily n=1 Tax=Roseospirillum parvum TaxID=83401 RepID=A0A1G7ZHH6_9PROT|nr:DMT family transporter [Roseospirillum parvum]SDH08158.1 Permease of the drug/metabolite transporter (DMT) superfamily [Roseospirillum parvum]
MPAGTDPRARGAWLAGLAPVLFVLLWSTGFIGAKFGLPHAEPLTFLAVRFAVVLLLLVPLALLWRAPWPGSGAQAGHQMVVGALVHGLYLGGVFMAIDRGIPAGLAALIVGLQPLLTALVAGPLLGERVGPRQWLGLALGLGGVILVVLDKAGGNLGSGLDPLGLGTAVGALVGITAGTLYQKRFAAGMDLRTGTAMQFLGALIVTSALALGLEEGRIDWTWEFIGALAWLVVVLSVGAISLLMFLIKRGEVSRVASLFYLVPPVTATIAWALFDERMGPLALVGMAVAVVGVGLAVVQPGRRGAKRL